MSSDKFLLFAEANSGEIYKVPLAVPDIPCIPLRISTNISRPVAVDYDPIEGKVYWTDVTLEQVARAYPNGSDLKVIAQHNVINPDGIAVDWIGRNLFWSDAGTNKIEVSRLDGSFRTSLITANVDKPRAVILNIEARLYTKCFLIPMSASPSSKMYSHSMQSLLASEISCALLAIVYNTKRFAKARENAC